MKSINYLKNGYLPPVPVTPSPSVYARLFPLHSYHPVFLPLSFQPQRSLRCPGNIWAEGLQQQNVAVTSRKCFNYLCRVRQPLQPRVLQGPLPSDLGTKAPPPPRPCSSWGLSSVLIFGGVCSRQLLGPRARRAHTPLSWRDKDVHMWGFSSHSQSRTFWG